MVQLVSLYKDPLAINVMLGHKVNRESEGGGGEAEQQSMRLLSKHFKAHIVLPSCSITCVLLSSGGNTNSVRWSADLPAELVHSRGGIWIPYVGLPSASSTRSTKPDPDLLRVFRTRTPE